MKRLTQFSGQLWTLAYVIGYSKEHLKIGLHTPLYHKKMIFSAIVLFPQN